MKTVVLLSGGIDSTAVLALALAQGYQVYTLLVDYGQRHQNEIQSAHKVQSFYEGQAPAQMNPLRVASVAFGQPLQSVLTDPSKAIPKDRTESAMRSGVALTYVPARNLFLLGLAASYAEQVGAETVQVGFNADPGNYPDCQPEFVASMNCALAVGMKEPVTIQSPLGMMVKAQILYMAVNLGAPLHLTWSCYDPQSDSPCGRCDACLIRSAAFVEIGLSDPALPRRKRFLIPKR